MLPTSPNKTSGGDAANKNKANSSSKSNNNNNNINISQSNRSSGATSQSFSLANRSPGYTKSPQSKKISNSLSLASSSSSTSSITNRVGLPKFNRQKHIVLDEDRQSQSSLDKLKASTLSRIQTLRDSALSRSSGARTSMGNIKPQQINNTGILTIVTDEKELGIKSSNNAGPSGPNQKSLNSSVALGLMPSQTPLLSSLGNSSNISSINENEVLEQSPITNVTSGLIAPVTILDSLSRKSSYNSVRFINYMSSPSGYNSSLDYPNYGGNSVGGGPINFSSPASPSGLNMSSTHMSSLIDSSSMMMTAGAGGSSSGVGLNSGGSGHFMIMSNNSMMTGPNTNPSSETGKLLFDWVTCDS